MSYRFFAFSGPSGIPGDNDKTIRSSHTSYGSVDLISPYVGHCTGGCTCPNQGDSTAYIEKKGRNDEAVCYLFHGSSVPLSAIVDLTVVYNHKVDDYIHMTLF